MARKPVFTEYHGARLSMSQLRYSLGITYERLAALKAKGRLNEAEIDRQVKRILRRAKRSAVESAAAEAE